MKHYLKCVICKMTERRLSPDQVRSATPATYGDVITYDHLNFLFDAQYEAMSRYSYLDLVGEILYWATQKTKKITVVDLAEHNDKGVRDELYM